MKNYKLIARQRIINPRTKRIHDDVGLRALDGYWESKVYEFEDSVHENDIMEKLIDDYEKTGASTDCVYDLVEITDDDLTGEYLNKSINAGYAFITGSGKKAKITYVTSDNHTENYSDPEEKVRAEFWAELIYKYEYPANRIKVEMPVPDRIPTDRADIVVFEDDDCKRPYIVVECKKDGVTDAEFLQAIEQGVGNATWVKLRAKYVAIVAGKTRRILDVSDNYGIYEREQNIIADLPKAYGKPQEFRFYKGGINKKGEEVSDIAPVSREELISAIKKCHQTLWGGGRLSPPTAFGELCKLIFVKISDEQKPRKKGEPYQFQIKTNEPSSKLAERINKLYDEQKVKDPEVFTDSIKVDDRVLRTVVSHLEEINLSKTDLDVKGVAFEQFMDGFFKGDFGQYFTPRPVIEFAVNMMKPEHDWDVLDIKTPRLIQFNYSTADFAA